MEFGVLGPLSVVDDTGREVDIGSPSQRALLATLVARAGRVVPLDELADAVWGDDPPASAVNTLRSQVSRLRRIVGDRVAGSADGYVLRLQHGDTVDAHRLETALRAARADPADPTAAAGELAVAVELWRGRAFGELADLTTVRNDARRLELARLDATELLAGAELASGHLAEAAALADRVVEVDELREPSWAILVRALARAGRPAEALRAARRGVTAVRGAGLDPGPDLRAAEQEALAVPEEAASQPAPAGAGTRQPARPPAPLTPTIGREEDCRRVLASLERARLVTVVGPGGVGKTRLSIDVARAVAEGFGRGAAFVELARVTDRAGVLSTIAAALEVRPAPGEELRALEGAGAVDTLLVLDNCEHVIDAVASIVPRLLGSGERLRVLATSREPLSVDGEHVVVLAPLTTGGPGAPAVELFRQRAAAVASAGDFDDALIAEVVARLDGLPLAVEMAAARLRTMSLGELASSIGDLDVLSSPRRDVEERHRTVRDLLAWSEHLLDDELRDTLFEFAVFAGPVRAADLPAVVRAPKPAETVARLVDRSLVLALPRSDGVRFGALATVRSYGRERLRTLGSHDACRRRHAEWFADAIADVDALMRTPDEADAVRRFGEIFDELRAAVRWSLDRDLDVAARIVHHSFLPGRVVLRAEVVSWAADVADRLPDDHPARWRVGAALSGGLVPVGRLADAVRIGQQVIDAVGAAPDALYAYEALGDAATYEGRLEDTLALARPLREAAVAAGDDFYVDMATMGEALVLAYLGRRDDALSALAAGPVSDVPTTAAWFEYVRGEAILDADPAAASEHLSRAETIARSVGDRYLVEVTGLSLSSLLSRTGSPTDAARRFVALLDHFGAGGDVSHLETTLRNLVTLLARLGRHRHATALLGCVEARATSPTYGAEAERLAAAEAECREMLGPAEFERVVAMGRARTLEEGVGAARAALGQ